MSASARLAELGIALPAVAKPVAAYVPAARVGGQIWTSGQLPSVDGVLTATGKLGAEVTAEEGAAAARVAVLNALASVAAVAGGIDNVRRVVKVVVYVASTPEFTAALRFWLSRASTLANPNLGSPAAMTRKCSVANSPSPTRP